MEKHPWPLFLSAPLLGICQSVLLVYTPIFLAKTSLPLATLALLMSFGSALFLFSTPMWAKTSLRWGYRRVLMTGVFGLTSSFSLLYLAVWGTSQQQWSLLWVTLVVLVARLIYGMMASAIVPTCQAWITEHNDVKLDAKNTLNKLAELSTVMAIGRLLAPLLALLLIWIDWRSPLLFLVFFPLTCLLCIAKFTTSHRKYTEEQGVKSAPLAADTDVDNAHETALMAEGSRLNSKLRSSLLLSITLICISHSTVIYLLTPMALQWLALDDESASQFLSLLMTLAALAMVLCHGFSSRIKIVNHFNMMLLANAMLVLSLASMLLASGYILLIAIPLLSGAFAILQLQITSLMCNLADKSRKAIATGLVAKFQTLGYVFGAGLLWLTHSDIENTLLVLCVLALAQVTSLFSWQYQIQQANKHPLITANEFKPQDRSSNI